MMFSLVLLAVMASAAQATEPPTANELVDRVARYIDQFEQDFEVILSDEQYEQRNVVKLDNPNQNAQTRKIESEMLFVRVAEDETWLAVRNVLGVDGKAVPDSRNRIAVALADTGPDRLPRLRRLRDEGARFNIGNIYHNFSDPTLVLQFLSRHNQWRFEFSVAGAEKVAGIDTWKLAFTELVRPTLAQSATSDLPSNGIVWVRAADGTVLRTSLTLRDSESNVDGRVVVDYRHDRTLNMWVPVRMTEQYTQLRIVNRVAGGPPTRRVTLQERIEGEARYSNFRRFETSGRIVP